MLGVNLEKKKQTGSLCYKVISISLAIENNLHFTAAVCLHFSRADIRNIPPPAPAPPPLLPVFDQKV